MKEGEGVFEVVRKKKVTKVEKAVAKPAKYQLFVLGETSRDKIYKAGRVISIIKDRGEELYVVGPRLQR